MASTTVLPNGDGTGLSGWQDAFGGSSTYYNLIDELVASANDSDGVLSTASNGVIYFLLQDMPSGLNAVTAVTIKVRASRVSGTRTLTAQIFQSDQSTALTNSQTTSNLSGTITNYTLTTSVTGATSKSAWDGARIKLTSSGADITVYAAQVDITYTASGNPGSLVDGGLVKSKLVTGRLVV